MSSPSRSRIHCDNIAATRSNDRYTCMQDRLRKKLSTKSQIFAMTICPKYFLEKFSSRNPQAT
uniref:Uncharacterized protein n=1 Tax=Rhizophora mucronata TaxID=61149 RepID=A0A2P2PUF5_RHIMU